MTNISFLPQYLEWDSQFFSRKIAKINQESLSPEMIETIDSWADKNRIECLYYLCSIEDYVSCNLVIKNGFDLIDLRYTLGINTHKLPVMKNKNIIRLADDKDIPDLRRLAGQSHIDTRFFSDPHFQREKCKELYEIWIEQSLHGFADVVFVSTTNDKVNGYITGKIKGDEGEIGLVAVDPNWQRKGIGRELIFQIINWFSKTGIDHVSVVTQGKNLSAQILYQRCGFISESLKVWFHKWYLLKAKS